MGKITVAMYVTLDGVMEEPSWTSAYFNDEVGQFQNELLFSSNALLLGRITYESFSEAWPQMEDTDGFADRMNSLPKFVATTTLMEPEWNATFLKETVAEEIRQLKKDGHTMLVYGSATLFETLLEHDLIDELHLMVFPLVLGEGKKLFSDDISRHEFLLKNNSITETGVVIASYTAVRRK